MFVDFILECMWCFVCLPPPHLLVCCWGHLKILSPGLLPPITYSSDGIQSRVSANAEVWARHIVGDRGRDHDHGHTELVIFPTSRWQFQQWQEGLQGRAKGFSSARVQLWQVGFGFERSATRHKNKKKKEKKEKDISGRCQGEEPGLSQRTAAKQTGTTPHSAPRNTHIHKGRLFYFHTSQESRSWWASKQDLHEMTGEKLMFTVS